MSNSKQTSLMLLIDSVVVFFDFEGVRIHTKSTELVIFFDIPGV